MDRIRRASFVTGILFLAADVAGVASVVALGTLLDGSDFLPGAVADADRVALAAVLEALMGLCCAGIAISMYPVLRRVDPGLAIGAVGMRAIEGTIFLLAALCLVALAALGADVTAGSIDANAAGPSADLLRALHAQAGTIAALPFAVGAFLYYLAFYRGRLTPRWLSGWGLLAIAVYFATAVWAMVGRTDFNDLSALLAPLALQEVVLAVWLIAKGWSDPAGAPSAAPSIPPAAPSLG